MSISIFAEASGAWQVQWEATQTLTAPQRRGMMSRLLWHYGAVLADGRILWLVSLWREEVAHNDVSYDDSGRIAPSFVLNPA